MLFKGNRQNIRGTRSSRRNKTVDENIEKEKRTIGHLEYKGNYEDNV